MKSVNKNIFMIIIGIILGSSITVGATALINANEIGYENDNLNANNVQDAIDEVYDLTKQGDALENNILLNKTALVNGSLVTGTMTDNGAWISNPTTRENVTIPAGFHDGEGYVNTVGLWDAAVAAADGRSAPGTVNYQSGYNAGVAASSDNLNISSSNVSAVSQPSYDTASVNLSRSYTFPSKGTYIINVLVSLSGTYSVGSVSLSGVSYSSIGSQSGGQSITYQYGASASLYLYKVVVNGGESVTVTVNFKTSQQHTSKNSFSLNVVKVT